MLRYLLPLLLMAGADIAWNGFRTLTWLEFLARNGGWIVLAALIVAVPVAVANLRSHPDELVPAVLIGGAITGILAALVGFAPMDYATNQRYLDQVATHDGAGTGFVGRAPWVVAERLSSRDQGDEVGDRGTVKAVPQPGEDASRYTTLITGRDALGVTGYVGVRQYLLPTDLTSTQGAGATCSFDGMDRRRWGAPWPAQSLNRLLRFEAPLLHFDAEDRYGYCDPDGSAVVVQPLWRYQGWLPAFRVPAGVAVFDQHGFRLLDGDQLDQVEGPVFPQSLAAKRRAATPALGTFWDALSDRAGYDLTVKDDQDANAGNASELLLVDTEGRLSYVTPLTPKGSSQSIVALFVADARTGQARIETAVDLPSTSTLEDRIRSASVAGDAEWATRWAAGMRVYEMVPAVDGTWVASIGREQEVEYRAVISPDGQVAVTRTDPDQPHSPTEPATEPVAGGWPLTELSEAELLDLIRAAVDELEHR